VANNVSDETRSGLNAERKLAHLRAAAELGHLHVPEFVLPTDRQTIVDAMRLHYLEWDADEGATDVLFLHGGALTAHTWDLACLALRPRYRCLALDQRGHGDSEWSPGMDYSRDAYVKDLEGIVDGLGLDQFVLVGHSLGGLNAIEYAGRHSQRLRALVLVDVGPHVRRAGAGRIRDFISGDIEFESVDEAVEQALQFNKARDAGLLRTSLLYNLRRLPHGAWTWKYDRRHGRLPDNQKLTESMQALAAVLPTIACPTLVVRGAQSDVFHDEDALRVAAAIPDARCVTVANAGHTVQGDNPRGFVDAVRPFLDEMAVGPPRRL